MFDSAADVTAASVAVGDIVAEATYELTRDSLVRYAGASGDFNPIHYRDDIRDLRRTAGRDRPRHAHDGHRRAARRRLGRRQARVTDYQVRFTRPVVVDPVTGATVSVVAKVGAVDDDGIRVDLTVDVAGRGDRARQGAGAQSAWRGRIPWMPTPSSRELADDVQSAACANRGPPRRSTDELVACRSAGLGARGGPVARARRRLQRDRGRRRDRRHGDRRAVSRRELREVERRIAPAPRAGGRPGGIRMVAFAVDAGLGGIEALSDIPGPSGAAPVRSIGASGRRLSDTLVSIEFRSTGPRRGRDRSRRPGPRARVPHGRGSAGARGRRALGRPRARRGTRRCARPARDAAPRGLQSVGDRMPLADMRGRRYRPACRRRAWCSTPTTRLGQLRLVLHQPDAFDDIAIVPSRRTRDRKTRASSWTIDVFTFTIPGFRPDGQGGIAGHRDRDRQAGRPRRARPRGCVDQVRGCRARAQADSRARGRGRDQGAPADLLRAHQAGAGHAAPRRDPCGRGAGRRRAHAAAHAGAVPDGGRCRASTCS